MWMTPLKLRTSRMLPVRTVCTTQIGPQQSWSITDATPHAVHTTIPVLTSLDAGCPQDPQHL
jgi:hypothetical protein